MEIRDILLLGLWAAAGLALFSFAYSRFILHLRSVRIKLPLIVLGACGFTGTAIHSGLATGWSAWIAVPLGILGLMLIEEGARFLLHRRCRADGPVETRNVGVSLLGPLTTTDLAVRRYELKHPAWTGRRLRAVHLTDLHVHGAVPMRYYHDVVETARELEPDLLFLTGDFLTRAANLPLLPRALTGVAAPLGVYAILGNHDWWEGGASVVAALRDSGCILLEDSWRRVATPEGGRLVVAGCELPWSGRRWEPPPRTPDEPLLVLTHTADNIYMLQRHAPLAVFAGHYHGGQAVIPKLGPVVVPSRYGRRFHHGHFLVGDTHLFVSAGIGCAFPPVRIYCQPEILVVDIRGGEAGCRAEAATQGTGRQTS
jgi:predicted MPP superfamily phosphohydrolase